MRGVSLRGSSLSVSLGANQQAIWRIFGLFMFGFALLWQAALWQSAFAQTGRPVSGVIAATDAPIQISYVNEAGESIGRIAGVGEPIYLNDEISTPDGASLQVLLRDQTVFSIGPNSTLIFDEFVFDPTALEDIALTASVTKGTFKFISGKVSKLKPGAMKLKLPNATASIRGTSVVGRVSDTGASDLVLLSGAVQLEAAGSVAPVDLVVPGWGVSVADTGDASEPEPFSAEDIDEIIQEVEFSEKQEAGEEETLAEVDEAAGDDEAAAEDEGTEDTGAEETAGETQIAESAATAEADPLVEAVREIGADGADVTEEDIATIIELAGGDEDAVADAIVKVIIDEQIASGEITTGDLETLTIETLTELAPDDFAIAELGEAGLDIGTDIADVIATRLDSALGDLETDLFAAPPLGIEVEETAFAFDDGGFGGFNTADIKLTETFKIEEVSRFIIETTAPDVDAAEVELNFFDILYNAEDINSSFEQEFGKDFSFEKAVFEEAAKEADVPLTVDPISGEITPEAEQTFNEVRGTLFAAREATTEEAADAPSISIDAPSLEVKAPTIAVEDQELEVKTPTLEAPTLEAPTLEAPTLEVKAPAFEVKAPEIEDRTPLFSAPLIDTKTDTPVETALILDELIEPEIEYREPEVTPEIVLEPAKEETELALARIIEENSLRAAETVVDPLEYYKAGKAEITWLDLKSNGSLGHLQDVNELIPTSYEGSATFEDTLRVANSNSGFSAMFSYKANLNYDSASVTGKMALSSVKMGANNYYDGDGNTIAMENFTTDLTSTPLKKMDTDINGNILNTGDDENGNGRLNVGEAVDDVRLSTVALYNNTDQTAATSTLNAHLDMSVGSVEASGSALGGLVGEFDVVVDELSNGEVARQTSIVRGTPQ